MAAADGIVGRGVLLDVPRALGVPHLPGNSAIAPDDLDARLRGAGRARGRGRPPRWSATGRDARRTEQRGRFDPIGDGMAGLHAECLPWLHERGVALLGGDGISDPMPGLGIHEWPFPIHQIGITRIGLMLIDNLRLDDLTDGLRHAPSAGSSCSPSAPLRVPGGTGCPVNPIAVL